MRKTEEKSIGGRVFKVAQLPGMRGAKLFFRLSSAVVPALARIGGGLGSVSEKSLLEEDVGPFLNAANTLFEKLTEAEFERLVRELLETTTVSRSDLPEQLLMPIFDEEMAGEIGTLLQLVAFALKVNFGNFMPGLVVKARAMAAKQKGSASKE
jgi:hypothetical protein